MAAIRNEQEKSKRLLSELIARKRKYAGQYQDETEACAPLAELAQAVGMEERLFSVAEALWILELVSRHRFHAETQEKPEIKKF